MGYCLPDLGPPTYTCRPNATVKLPLLHDETLLELAVGEINEVSQRAVANAWLARAVGCC